MNEDDLRRIEAQLGRPLPQAFRRVMLNFPRELLDAATLTDPDGNEFRDEMVISPDAEAILAGIIDREPGWPDPTTAAMLVFWSSLALSAAAAGLGR